MSRKQKMMRLLISGSLLAAVALVGVSVYQVEMNQQERMEVQESAEAQEKEDDAQAEHLGGNSTATADEEPHHAVVDDEEEELPPTEETTSDQVVAQTETPIAEAETEKEAESAAILPGVNFTEDSLLDWPVKGTVIMDYSMDHTVYFPTLDVYKYNPSVVLGAAVGEPVEAAANGKIVKIEESIETGTTITADIGNGYQVVYGQLKNVLVNENDVVAAGTVLGYVNDPTRFYTEEGSNLYFAMTKDGESIDPILYLP